MKLALIALGIVVVLLLAVVAAGWALPVKHRAHAEATIAATPEQVFALITNVADFPKWRTGLRSVDVLPPSDGRRRFREVSKSGAITFAVDSEDPPRRLVGRIDDRSLPFGGTWTYELAPAANGATTLRITEDGEIYNPVFRFVSRYVMGYESTIRQYLADVARACRHG